MQPGQLDAPQILYGPRGKRSADYLGLLAQTTLAAEKLGGTLPTIAATKTQVTRSTTSVGGQHQSAFFAVFGIFFLTLFLSGQVVGTMAEERNNKVIEVLAAAVPLESVFFGKLIGMFGVAVLFVAFWGTVVTQITSLMPAAAAVALGDLTPAVGAPMFALLFAAYFSMAYLLLGSVFLGVGAQATTMREIQMLSLPITILQVAANPYVTVLGPASTASSRLTLTQAFNALGTTIGPALGGAALAHAVDESVVHDGQQPAAQVAAGAEGVTFIKGLHQGVMDQVVGLVAVAGQRQGIAAQGLEVGGDRQGFGQAHRRHTSLAWALVHDPRKFFAGARPGCRDLSPRLTCRQ